MKSSFLKFGSFENSNKLCFQVTGRNVVVLVVKIGATNIRISNFEPFIRTINYFELQRASSCSSDAHPPLHNCGNYYNLLMKRRRSCSTRTLSGDCLTSPCLLWNRASFEWLNIDFAILSECAQLKATTGAIHRNAKASWHPIGIVVRSL